MSSQQAVRVVIVAMLATAGCGAPVCSSLRPTIEADDVPIGEPGFSIRVVAARPDQRWVVFSQVMEDTNGDGLLSAPEYSDPGDASEIFFVRGMGPAERIDAFLGATDDALGVVRDGVFELVNVRTGERQSFGPAPLLTYEPYQRAPGTPNDAWFTSEGLLVTPTRDRQGVELIDTQSGVRRVIPAPGWVHAVGSDASGSWVVIESIDGAPTDPSDWQLRPQLPNLDWMSHPPYGPCQGLGVCEGPTRTFQFVDLRSAVSSPLMAPPFERGDVRAWGFVFRDGEITTLMGPDGTSQSLAPRCVTAYIAQESPVVVAHCYEITADSEVPGASMTVYGPLYVVRLGSSETEPFNEQTMASLAEVDRTLIARSDVQAAMLQGRLNADHSRAYFYPTTLHWHPEIHTWSDATRRGHRGVVAVSPDGSALLSRWSSSGRICEAELHQTQLVWVQLNERWRRELSIFDYRNRDDLSP